jgi:hypothetical protein
MKSKKPKKQRIFQTVMNDTSADPAPWDLDEHLNGCLAAYQIEDVIQEGAEKFDKADITVRRAWEKFRKLEKAKNKK